MIATRDYETMDATTETRTLEAILTGAKEKDRAPTLLRPNATRIAGEHYTKSEQCLPCIRDHGPTITPARTEAASTAPWDSPSQLSPANLSKLTPSRVMLGQGSRPRSQANTWDTESEPQQIGQEKPMDNGNRYKESERLGDRKSWICQPPTEASPGHSDP